MPGSWRTKLIHPGVSVPEGFRSLASPIYRGSTTLFDTAAQVQDNWRHEEAAYTYGLYGTPTTLELGARIAELEHGTHTLLTPGGQAAIALVYFAFAVNGDHALVPESIYGPHRGLADGLLGRLGIEVDPLIGSGIEALLRPNTRLIWCESPGSVTMEVQDAPAIAAVAHRHRVVLALDNTYAAGLLFDAFAHGVDVTMQALTKYIGGHSDLLLGSVTVRENVHYEALGKAHQLLGMAVSPDDSSLALRGLQTLGVRLTQLERSTLAIAQWLSKRPEIRIVLHPALTSCPGHEVGARLRRFGQRLLDRLRSALLEGRNHSLRRQLATVQDRLQLGWCDEFGRPLLRCSAQRSVPTAIALCASTSDWKNRRI